ncbi:malto-oligosyltrehalose synthase [Frateuria defendens]|uniref:malto-oligosyltrehalose synthase n=1 Tax=Frateuria defendens TaxID=2219559 RepID=UPI00066FDB48|nr:malto-oligosyltrehalose synthase [Frateuria defendens]
MPELRATARLQLHRGFGFADATDQVPYYAALGVSHLYLSPIATARSGSGHGYDAIDPTRINPELGGEPGFHELVRALRRHGMGCLLDIVPNHVAADTANPWWRDVLALGRGSAYAGHFDIDWDAPGGDGRLLLPVLGGGLGEALREGTLTLEIDPDERGLAFALGGQRYPLSAAGLRRLFAHAGLDAPPPGAGRADLCRRLEQTLASPALLHLETALRRLNEDARRGGAALRELLDLQHYRLAWWRRGNDEINYRRFFDIGGLAALRVERPAVFEAVHALPLRLVAEGLVDGLRLDHIDGLAAPGPYLRRLRRRLDAAAAARPTPLHGPVPLYVEKILAHGEALPADWPVDGSTGYDFMDQAAAVLHDGAGEAPLRLAWAACADEAGFARTARQARRELLAGGLHAEHAACTRAWHALARGEADGAEFSAHALGRALTEVLEQLHVYRSYLGPAAPTLGDRAALDHALAAAARHGDPDLAEARSWLRRQLLERTLRGAPPGPPRIRLREARRRFEQLAAPLNAKAVEDTAFYRYGVLLSRNEVGADPRHVALSPVAFHETVQRRAARFPHALLATATHDHKRGEDTRARLAVLSERADWFAEHAADWIARLHAIAAVDPADLWMLLQTLLAAWPLELDADDAPGLAAYAGRLAAWQLKALREGKRRSRWTTPDAVYETACRALLDTLFATPGFAPLRRELAAAARSLDAPGALNGLAQCTLRLTVPGVPDLYQGTERWDLSLVDPDNRRPVDYALRRAGPPPDADPAALLRGYRSGAIKQWLIARLLGARHRHPALFAEGGYTPLALHGRHAARALAFARRHGDEHWLVVVPRLVAPLLTACELPQVPPAAWADTALALPDDVPCTWRELCTGSVRHGGAGSLALGHLLERWPLAVLRRETGIA